MTKIKTTLHLKKRKYPTSIWLVTTNPSSLHLHPLGSLVAVIRSMAHTFPRHNLRHLHNHHLAANLHSGASKD